MLIYMIAGEPSGDLLGARLIKALESLRPGLEFAGIGGENMAEAGLPSLFPQEELAVMGFLEVLPRIFNLRARIKQTVAEIERLQPAAVITIDSWGFTGRVAKLLKARGSNIPRIHYVAPMVWAWKEKRVHQLAERLDLLLTLLPNEPEYFIKAGLKTFHVGHSVLESGADKGDGRAFRELHKIDYALPLLCLLPGSRNSETSRLIPVFAETARLLARQIPGLRLVIPTVATVSAQVKSYPWPLPYYVVEASKEKYAAFAASNFALAASGTVSLELALADVPHIIAYKVNPLTAFLARRLLKIKYVNLLNLWLDKEIIPEFLQENAKPELMSKALLELYEHSAAQRADIHQALEILRGHTTSPSLNAANRVLEFIGSK